MLYDLGCVVQGLWFMLHGYTVQGLVFRDQELGVWFRVQGLITRVQGLRFRIDGVCSQCSGLSRVGAYGNPAVQRYLADKKRDPE